MSGTTAAMGRGADRGAVRSLTEQRELVRHYTLSGPDLAAVRRCRGDHNRLGTALMLCYLHHPGRPLPAGERPPPALIAFVASQLDIDPEAFDDSAAAERSPSAMRSPIIRRPQD